MWRGKLHSMAHRSPALMAERFHRALEAVHDTDLCALDGAVPADPRDTLSTLLSIHELSTAAAHTAPGRARWQHHHTVQRLKATCERDLRGWLDAASATGASEDTGDPVTRVRRIAADDRVPVVYRWIAEAAGWDDLVGFLALEGGPDHGFDDLVAACQIGLEGRAKMEMARNFWDEMGGGDPDRVHRVLYRRFATAVDLPSIPRAEQPVEVLRRSALDGYLATNRHLQPEAIGALGLTELQAGPRCRHVVAAMERLGASPPAIDFYAEHADTDPRHGKVWLDEIVAPLADDTFTAEGIVRGAKWRSAVNRDLFDMLAARLIPSSRLSGVGS